MSRQDRSAPPASDRANLYDEITGKIIAELEAGRFPWVQPWGSSTALAPLGLPRNASTGRAYSGINILILWGAVIQHGFAKRKSIAAIIKEVMTNEQSALVDTDAANKAADADMALQELGADVAGMAYVTATVTVWDEDARRADEKLRLVEKVVQSRDFSVMVETVNAVDAWLGSLPGHAYANVRQPPISTLNLAHMVPSSAVWAGPERDDHFGAPPLLYGRTEGSTPFRLSLHVGDVGHTLVVGPTGAGKSVLLALMALQFRRYVGSQIFAFDFGGSIRAAALAMGGDWHDLGGELTDASETSVSLQPLARIHQTAERAWAADWIVAILTRENIQITPEVKEYIWTALTSLASAPVGERTITGLAVLLQSNDLKQALRAYCVGGPYGRLLDAEAEHLGSADVQAFEIEGLVGTGAAPAVLSYLFHRVGDRLDGRPTLLIIDEGWLALDDEGFADQLREWLKTLRKKNASVIFATRAADSMKSSYSDGARAGFAASGGSSSMGTVGGTPSPEQSPPSAADGLPAWAQKMRRSRAMSHGVTAAAHAVRSGDSHGPGSSVSLSESDRT